MKFKIPPAVLTIMLSIHALRVFNIFTLSKGANSNAVDSSGLPILSLAASHGHVEAMNVLIEQGNANINAQARRYNKR